MDLNKFETSPRESIGWFGCGLNQKVIWESLEGSQGKSSQF